MRAATIAAPPAGDPAAQVPLYTRHMLGAIEAARDRRIHSRTHGVRRGRPSPLRIVPPRWDDDGGRLPADTIPATIVARAA
jgi:hypothetical protein